MGWPGGGLKSVADHTCSCSDGVLCVCVSFCPFRSIKCKMNDLSSAFTPCLDGFICENLSKEGTASMSLAGSTRPAVRCSYC